MWYIWWDKWRRKFVASKRLRRITYSIIIIITTGSWFSWLGPTTMFLLPLIGPVILFTTWTTGAVALFYYVLCSPHLYDEEYPKYPLLLTILYYVNNFNIFGIVMLSTMYSWAACLPETYRCNMCCFYYGLNQIIYSTYLYYYMEWDCYSLYLKQLRYAAYAFILLYFPAACYLYSATWKLAFINLFAYFFNLWVIQKLLFII